MEAEHKITIEWVPVSKSRHIMHNVHCRTCHFMIRHSTKRFDSVESRTPQRRSCCIMHFIFILNLLSTVAIDLMAEEFVCNFQERANIWFHKLLKSLINEFKYLRFYTDQYSYPANYGLLLWTASNTNMKVSAV